MSQLKQLLSSQRAMGRLALLALLVLVLGTVGCASTGSGGGAEAPAAAKPDYTQEIGENGLPTPRALVARFIEAIGGEEAIRSGEYATINGKMRMPAMGMEGTMTLYTKAPNMMNMQIDLGGFGSMNTGFNGEYGWNDSPMTGPQLLEGEMLTEVKRQADFYSELSYDENYPVQETLEEVDWEGSTAYKVKFVDADGKETIQYFDKESSLLVGTEGKQVSDMGEMDVTTVLSDYEEFGPVKAPTKTVLKMMGMEIEQTVEAVSFEPIDDAKFAPPEAIQKLIDNQ